MPPASRQRKLRASCDSCNESRVRCSQTRPTCSRCMKNNVNCIYGISQRAGRNRASTQNGGVDEQNQLAGHHTHPPSCDPVSLLQQPSHGQICDGFSANSIDSPEPNIFFEMFGGSPLPASRNASDMRSTIGLGDSVVDARCACVCSVFSFISTHPILTGTHPAPIDACLVKGRESINACELILNCVCLSQHHYSSLITVALFIDRVVAIYDRARQHYHQTLLVPPYPYSGPSAASIPLGSELSTESSSSLSLAEGMPEARIDTSGEDLFHRLKGSACRPAFIGEYQLDKNDDVKMTFEIVFGHLSRVHNLIRSLKKGISREAHMGPFITELIAPLADDHQLGYNYQASVCLKLADLIERQLNVTRSGWESICKEWELYQ